MSGGGIRVARNLSAGAVAAIAAWSSYSHMVHVALSYHEAPQVAYALPFSVDGMLIVASVVMVDNKRRAHRVRPIARLAFTAGMVASIAANIAAAHPSLGARIVDAWPALALLLVVEMLARPPAPAAAQVPPPATAPLSAQAAQRRPDPRTPAELPPPAVGQHAAIAYSAQLSRQPARQPAAAYPPYRSGVGQDSQAVPPRDEVPSPERDEVPPPAALPRGASSAPGNRRAATAVAANQADRRQSSRRSMATGIRRPTAATLQLARQIIAAEPDLSRTEVAARLGVSTRRLREVLATAA